MKRFTRLPTLLLLSTTMLSGCEDVGSSAGRGALAGSRWRLAEWSASSLQPSDFTITATFDQSGIVGNSAVNTYRGSYSDAGGTFSIRGLSTTEIAGPEPAMRAEHIYLELLRDARRFERRAERLVLMGEAGNELLLFTPVK